MKWIKASEGLPENNNSASLKNKIKRHIVTGIVYSETEILDYDAHTMYVEGRNDDIYVAIDNIEWLDETPDDKDKEIERLTGLIRDAYYDTWDGVGAEWMRAGFDQFKIKHNL